MDLLLVKADIAVITGVRCLSVARFREGDVARLPLPVDKALHQPLRLAGQERLAEHADAEDRRIPSAAVLPIAAAGLSARAAPPGRIPAACRRPFLDRGVEAAFGAPRHRPTPRPARSARRYSRPSSPASARGPSRSAAAAARRGSREGMPTLTSGMPNLASCAAIRKSQAAANSSPPPRHQPGIRAITGAGNARTASQRSRKPVMNFSAEA